MGIGTAAKAVLGGVAGGCVTKGLLMRGEFIVSDVVGGANGWFGVTGQAFSGVFPLPFPVFEFPGCTGTIEPGVCVPSLLTECTQDDKTFKNSCGWRKGSLVMVGTQAASLLRVERTKDSSAAITLGSAIRSVACTRACVGTIRIIPVEVRTHLGTNQTVSDLGNPST